MVSNIFLFSPRTLGKISNLTSIFFRWVGSTTNQIWSNSEVIFLHLTSRWLGCFFGLNSSTWMKYDWQKPPQRPLFRREIFGRKRGFLGNDWLCVLSDSPRRSFNLHIHMDHKPWFCQAYVLRLWTSYVPISSWDLWGFCWFSPCKRLEPEKPSGNEKGTSIPLCSNPFCKWFWSGFWVPNHLLTGYLEIFGALGNSYF